jgi:hypothetical protein
MNGNRLQRNSSYFNCFIRDLFCKEKKCSKVSFPVKNLIRFSLEAKKRSLSRNWTNENKKKMSNHFHCKEKKRKENHLGEIINQIFMGSFSSLTRFPHDANVETE